MTDSDDLRLRLSRIDPVPDSFDPITSPRASELLERTMSTPVLDRTDTAPRRRPRRVLAAAAAVAAVGVAGLGAAVVVRGNDKATPPAASTVKLALPDTRGAVASCMPFNTTILRDMSPAFAGTVATVEPTRVVLDVDRWYAGGNADQVVLSRPDASSSASLDSVAFEPGKRYLVTAANGTVNGCGYSGLATPELEKAFNDAFGG